MAIIIRLALVGLFIVSCSRWHNDANRLQLVCGPHVDEQKYSYIQLNEPASTQTDAIIRSQGEWQPLTVSLYGCLEIPRDIKGEAEIAIRDRNSTEGRVISLASDARSTLLTTELSSEPKLSPNQIRIVCPSDPYVTQKRVALQRVVQPSRLLSQPVIQAELYTAEGEKVQVFELQDETSGLDLDPMLQEGHYQLKLISQDAFERNAPPFESSCQIRLDRTPPIITSSLAEESYYDQAKNIRRLTPDSQITFQIEDANEAEPSVCLKPHPAVCSDEDFLPLRSIRAPGKGLWDLKAYATDRTGQKSKLLEETFAVYQQDLVNNLLTLLSNTNLSLLLGDQPHAIATMQEAKKIRNLLQLEGERAAVQWTYIDTFWKLDQQINLIKSLDVKQTIRNLTASTWTDDFLVQGDAGTSLLFQGEREPTAPDPSLRADFSGQGALWTFNRAGVIKLYENRELVRSFQSDLSGLVLLAAGQNSDKAVAWVDKGQETLVRVYDRKSSDDAPVFKANLPKTPSVKGKFSFMVQDRYLIGRNNNQLLVWDSEKNFEPRAFLAPNGCVVQDYAVRLDQKLIILSQRQSTAETGAIPPERSFCDLQVIDINNDSLTAQLTPRLSNLTYPNSLALSADPEQKYLALGRTVGSYLHLLDLKNEDSNMLLKLNDGENAARVEPISEKTPSFFVNTGKRVLLLQLVKDKPTEFFSSATLGSCLPQTRWQRLLCYQPDSSTLHIHSSERDRTLQPYLFRNNTEWNSPDIERQYQTASLIEKPLHAFFDHETRSIQLLTEDKAVQASAVLKSDVTALSLHKSESLALGLQDGTVAVLEKGSGLTLRSDGAETGKIVTVRMTGDHVYALRKKADDSFVLETLRYEAGRLSLSRSLSLPSGPAYSDILYSEKSGHGVVYQKDRTAVTQEAVLFTEQGDDSGRVPMSMGSLHESRDGSGFHFVKDQSIYFHDFASGRPQLVVASLNMNPSAFLEGEQLYAIADYGSGLYMVASGQQIASGNNFGMGPKGTIIVVDNDNVKILSADGKTTHVNMKFRMPTYVDALLSSPDHPDIVLTVREPGLGQGIKRLTTDLNGIDQRLKLWAN